MYWCGPTALRAVLPSPAAERQELAGHKPTVHLILPFDIVVSYIDTIMALAGKHRRTLASIFDVPVRSDVRWADIEMLLEALGAELTEGRGSRTRVYLNGVRAVFHRPHPRKETDKGALRSVRRFLVNAGVAPEDSE